MQERQTELPASPHAPEPGGDQLSETQVSVETIVKPQSTAGEAFSLQDIVSTPSELNCKGSSLAQKRLSFSQERKEDSLGFKLSPGPMCYHPRKRSPVKSQASFSRQQRSNEDQETDSGKTKGIIKNPRPQLRHKTVSFSTALQAEKQESDKENKSPEDLDLADSLELQPRVPISTPRTKASMTSSVARKRKGEDDHDLKSGTATMTSASAREDEVSLDFSYEEKVRCKRMNSLEPRPHPKCTSDKCAKLTYCPACDRDSRTTVVFEAIPIQSFHQLLCCWEMPKRQVMAVHKCVGCKRVIARILQ